MATQNEKIGTPQAPVDLALRKLLRDLIKKSKRRRERIAADMSTRIERKISKRMLDDWTAPKKRAKFPAAFIDAFCQAVGSDALQRHVMGVRLRELVESGERVYGMEKTLRELLEKVVELRAQEPRTKGKEKPTPKA